MILARIGLPGQREFLCNLVSGYNSVGQPDEYVVTEAFYVNLVSLDIVFFPDWGELSSTQPRN